MKAALRKSQGPAMRFLKRGLGTVLPIFGTIAILTLVLGVIDQYAVTPINKAVYWSLESNNLGWQVLKWSELDPYDEAYLEATALPIHLQAAMNEKGFTEEGFRTALRDWRRQNEAFFKDFDTLAISRERLHADVTLKIPPAVGFLVSLLFVLWLGSLASGFVGRGLTRVIDRAMRAIPLVRSIYPYTKQVCEFFLEDDALEFDTVVAVPYPSEGLWSVGFVTGTTFKTLREATGKDLVNVFVPSSPMPMTGYTTFCEVERLIPLPFTVDEALRATVSGGVLIPESERVQRNAVAALEQRRSA